MRKKINQKFSRQGWGPRKFPVFCTLKECSIEEKTFFNLEEATVALLLFVFCEMIPKSENNQIQIEREQQIFSNG